ncbi:MAG TPA: DNA recombination protein RmuC [Prolixibacteraceae bacterium]|nr:DNA recombination protein RmuC [Prolixibacteraceae bacterium]
METVFQVIVLLFVALIVLVVFFILNSKHKSEKLRLVAELEKNYSEQLLSVQKELFVFNERNEQLKLQLQKTDNELVAQQLEKQRLREQIAQLLSENRFAAEKLQEQNKAFEQLQQQAVSTFENLANKILKKNTEDLTELNQKRITELIHPLREKIQQFEKKVEETYEKGLRDQTDLKVELKKLYELNNRISNEANNLTRALKGDVKKQGNWGEMVLERILERSGLTEGQEFEREKVITNAEGKTIRPDVLVNLPDKKHIIIDSKVSLLAYERFVNSDDPDERKRWIKDHIVSLKSHVKELNVKHYSSSPQINTPDFVLLFIPIESSFSVAVEEDQQLFNYAWENKVVIVSPSTLLATLRTIASIWQQENQTRNAIEIARQSGALYDKFVGFIADIEKIGKGIESLNKTYDDAGKKLYTGTGNLVRRVEKLKELGASTTKQIPDHLID